MISSSSSSSSRGNDDNDNNSNGNNSNDATGIDIDVSTLPLRIRQIAESVQSQLGLWPWELLSEPPVQRPDLNPTHWAVHTLEALSALVTREAKAQSQPNHGDNGDDNLELVPRNTRAARSSSLHQPPETQARAQAQASRRAIAGRVASQLREQLTRASEEAAALDTARLRAIQARAGTEQDIEDTLQRIREQEERQRRWSAYEKIIRVGPDNLGLLLDRFQGMEGMLHRACGELELMGLMKDQGGSQQDYSEGQSEGSG